MQKYRESTKGDKAAGVAGGEAGAGAAGGGEFLDEAGAAVAAAFGETVLPASIAVRSSSNGLGWWWWWGNVYFEDLNNLVA